ncbi:MAG: UDP-N-acetylmuramate--L-alanine ligase [Tissierellia bacterium]|nr:UDP-N-acetylmuramate--L-alanine ligase [Tissierellia bacterium]
MFTFNLDDHSIKNIHFIGIGGVSMSGIARLLDNCGFHITGSDRDHNEHTKLLEELGISVSYGQKPENINQPDLVVYTDAIQPDNPELVFAKTLDIPVVTRGVFLGALMKNYVHSIAVSGSHGKSSTTSMLATILYKSDIKPSVLLGGDLDLIGGNALVGEREYLVTEACEYKANILHYFPSIAIVLNISVDHPDFFRDLDHLIETFQQYMRNLGEEDTLIVNIDDENCLPLIEHVKGRVITFGATDPNADFHIQNIILNENGKPGFDLVSKDGRVEHFQLDVIGEFNVLNATASIIASELVGMPMEVIREQIEGYHPLHRRMEEVGSYNGALVMTDYGHHPKEIRTTLGALRRSTNKHIICAFQPHTYSRTKRLLNDFAECFYDADEVIVTDIYGARESLDPTIHSLHLVEKLEANQVNVKYLATFEEARDYLQAKLGADDIVITTGCGIPHLLAYMVAEVGDYAPTQKTG